MSMNPKLTLYHKVDYHHGVKENVRHHSQKKLDNVKITLKVQNLCIFIYKMNLIERKIVADNPLRFHSYLGYLICFQKTGERNGKMYSKTKFRINKW